MIPVKTPILITGSPHSGKSLLAKILGQNQQFHCFGEALSLWNYGMSTDADDVRSEADATPEIIAEIREGIQKTLIREQKERYIDEFSYHALRIPFVKKVLPEAKVIMLVRDPADVIPEMMYFWKYRDPIYEVWKRHKKTISWNTLPSLAKKFLINYVAVRLCGRRQSWGPMAPGVKDRQNKSLAETVAQQWESLVRIGSNDIQTFMKDRSLVVKFEDMVRIPEIVISEIAEFCELEDYEEIVNYAANLMDPTYRFEKRDIIEPETSLMLEILIREMRQKFGYEIRESWL